MGLDRRQFLSGLGLVSAGAAAGGIGSGVGVRTWDSHHAPKSAPSTYSNGHSQPKRSQVEVTWNVHTEKKLIALTFDDGPMPNWTPRVHDILDEADVPATFFLVGERVRKYSELIKNRLGRHEIGNHTWSHHNLSTLSPDEAINEVRKAHDAIESVTGKEPRRLRPPWGHCSGSTLLAAAEMGYDITLWSLQMPEKQYRHNFPGLANYIVENTIPGTIALAHDVGAPHRLTTIKALPDIVKGLRSKGFEFVTVSELVAESPSRSPAPSISTITGVHNGQSGH